MKKILLGIVLIAALGGYLVWTAVRPPASTPVSTTAGSDSNPSTSPTTTPPPATAGTYKDGTYTGPVTDAFYGKMQVTVTITGGKITDVTFPQYPNTAGHTQEVSSEALPVLKSEAIAAQSAKVDIVSGATQDTQAFQESLGAALTQAQS